MPLRAGLVGLPNAGKSTLFNALTRAGAAVAAYPFTTIEPNVGVAAIPDPRLDALAALIKPQRVVPATVEVVDIAGLVEKASEGAGLGTQFLGHIRDVDAMIVVIACFTHPDVTHVAGGVDPRRDAGILATELLLSDLTLVERRIERIRTPARTGEREAQRELALLETARDHLNQGQAARTLPLTDDERRMLSGFGLLTARPALYVANVAESDLPAAAPPLPVGEGPGVRAVSGVRASPGQRCARELHDLASAEGTECIVLSAQLEAELADLEPEDQREYLATLGIEAPGRDTLLRACLRLLHLVTFYTVTGGEEVRAWPVPAGTRASRAAGKVHSDMERGFIRAEVVGVNDLLGAGSLVAARDRGLARLEGRDYLVQDGDVIHFRFHV